VVTGKATDDFVAGDGHQHDLCNADSGSELYVGPVTSSIDHGFGDCVPDSSAGAASRGFLCVPDVASTSNVVSPVAQSGIEPEDSAAWA
jgi:hypothetical protein